MPRERFALRPFFRSFFKRVFKPTREHHSKNKKTTVFELLTHYNLLDVRTATTTQLSRIRYDVVVESEHTFSHYGLAERNKILKALGIRGTFIGTIGSVDT